MLRGLRVITLQGAIEKKTRNIGKINDWMTPKLFRILVVAIIFSPTVNIEGFELLILDIARGVYCIKH